MLLTDNFHFYIGIFALIFLSFLFTRTFFTSGAENGTSPGNRLWHLPWYFQHTLWLFLPFYQSIGNCLRPLMPMKLMKIRQDLLTANIVMPAELVVTAQLMGFLLSFLLLFFGVILLLASGLGALCAGITGALLAWCYPVMLLDRIIQDRQTSIKKDLPFAIDLLTSAMRAGLDFSAALRYYVSNSISDSPLVQEFSQVLREVELGKTRSEALDAMARKVNIREFTSFASAVNHGIDIGASIVDTLKIQGNELRQQRFSQAERKAARAPSLMILPVALFIMPAFFLMVGIPVFLRLSGNSDAMKLFNH